jgi:hypothetical protein
MKPQGGGYTHTQRRRWNGGDGQRHAPAALFPGKTHYPLYKGLDEPWGRFGRIVKISLPTGFRTLNRPARCDSLYWL